MEKTTSTYCSTFKTDIIKVGIVFSISRFFIDKIYQASYWRAKKILSFLLELGFRSYDLFQAEKRQSCFIQNNFDLLSLTKQFFLIFSAIDKSRDPGTN
jgi:hypothetical protein